MRRLLFELLPKRLLVHMPDERLLVSHSEIEPASTDDDDYYDDSSLPHRDQHASAQHPTYSQHNTAGGRRGNKQQQQRAKASPGRLRRAALRRLLHVTQPEGRERRMRAGVRAAALGAARALVWVGAGFLAGVVVGRGRERERGREGAREGGRVVESKRGGAGRVDPAGGGRGRGRKREKQVQEQLDALALSSW